MKKNLLTTMMLLAVLVINAQISDLAVTASQTNIYAGESVTISTDSSQVGYQYVLRDNSDSTIIAGPLAGNGNDIEFTTAPLTESISYNVYASNQYCAEFTNGNDYINFGINNRNISTEVTVAAWVKSNGGSGLRNIVIDYGSEDAGYILRLDGQGKVYMSGRDNTNTYKSSDVSSTIVTDNQWHYVVGTINLNTGMWSVYIDGVLESSQNYGVGGITLSNFSGLNIGNTFSSSSAFIGEIRDVTLWNVELSASQIMANMSACLDGSEADIVGHFPLNEGNGTSIVDYSSIAENGNAQFASNGWVANTSTCREGLQMSQIVDIILVPEIADLPVIADDYTVNQGQGTFVKVSGSQLAHYYTLRNGTDIIDGPIAGTGADILFSTGVLNQTTTFNVEVTDNNGYNMDHNFTNIACSDDTRNIDDKVTVSAWIKTNSSDGKRNIVLDYGNDSGFILRTDGTGKVFMEGRDGTGDYKTSGASTTVVTDGEWHNVLGTIDLATGVWSVYVDAVLENTQTYAPGTTFDNNSELFIGSKFSTSNAFIGQIVNVGIYNKVLNSAEINTQYNGCVNYTNPDLVGFFPLNEGLGTTVLDYSSTSINGVINLPYTSEWVESDNLCRQSVQLSQTATINVTIPNVLVNSIGVQGAGGASIINVFEGSLQMEASVLPTNATDGSYTWSVVNGTGTANISASGILTAVADGDGTVTVIATANDGSGVQGSATITITNQSSIILVTNIIVGGQGSINIIESDGGTLQMVATVLPANATDGSYIWSISSAENIATISASGLVTATGNGMATVSASANDGSGAIGLKSIFISNQIVAVNEIPSEDINIYPNPVQDELFIDLKNWQMTKVDIIDFSGKIIKSISGDVNRINVSNLSQGIYILKVETKDGIATSGFLKQ